MSVQGRAIGLRTYVRAVSEVLLLLLTRAAARRGTVPCCTRTWASSADDVVWWRCRDSQGRVGHSEGWQATSRVRSHGLRGIRRG